MAPTDDGVPRTLARDPYLVPAFSLANRLARLAWACVYWTLFRFSPPPLHGWRALLLRAFGAELGPHCHIYASARIWAPWNLACADVVTIGPGATVYNPAPVRLGSHAIVSQQAYLCGATHDYDDPAFPLVASTITIGARAWVAARATVMLGVAVGEGAVLGLGSVATRDLEPWTVYSGVPALRVGTRRRHPVAAGPTVAPRAAHPSDPAITP